MNYNEFENYDHPDFRTPFLQVMYEDYPGRYDPEKGIIALPDAGLYWEIIAQYPDEDDVFVPSYIQSYGHTPGRQDDGQEMLVQMNYYFTKFSGTGLADIDHVTDVRSDDELTWKQVEIRGYRDEEYRLVVLPPLDVVGIGLDGDLSEAELVVNSSRDEGPNEKPYLFQIAYQLLSLAEPL